MRRMRTLIAAGMMVACCIVTACSPSSEYCPAFVQYTSAQQMYDDADLVVEGRIVRDGAVRVSSVIKGAEDVGGTIAVRRRIDECGPKQESQTLGADGEVVVLFLRWNPTAETWETLTPDQGALAPTAARDINP